MSNQLVVFNGNVKKDNSITKIFGLIEGELVIASKYPDFHSPHEGYAVMQEGLDKLWDLVKANKGVTGDRLMMNEAVQVAAMAVKFIHSLCRGCI